MEMHSQWECRIFFIYEIEWIEMQDVPGFNSSEGVYVCEGDERLGHGIILLMFSRVTDSSVIRDGLIEMQV